MYLAIAADGVTLHQPEVVTDLYASYWQNLGPDQIARVLTEHDAGELLDDRAHVAVPLATLRRLAEGRVADGWEADVLADARGKGRLNAEGDAVRAPLERER